MVGRYDIWHQAAEKTSAQWPEWQVTVIGNLITPIASPELMQQYRAEPRTKARLSELRLPEYWQKVGWPDMCQPVGEDDFECH